LGTNPKTGLESGNLQILDLRPGSSAPAYRTLLAQQVQQVALEQSNSVLAVASDSGFRQLLKAPQSAVPHSSIAHPLRLQQ